MDGVVTEFEAVRAMPDVVDNAHRPGPFKDAMLLSEGVAARICHDIAGPLGALAGTLQMALEGADDELGTLATELVDVLTTRVRLLRMAFGGGEAPSPASLQSLLQGLPGAERLRLDLAALPQDLPDELRSITPILLLLAAASLPRGGVITLRADAGTLHMRVDGPRAGWPERLASCVHADAADLANADEPRGIAMLVACLQVRSLGYEIVIDSATALRVPERR